MEANPDNLWKLVLTDDTPEGKEFPITGEVFLLGRAMTADVPLDDPRISRHHARITRHGDELFIEDMNSFNGTRLNQVLLTGPHVLQPQDIIEIGPFTLKVVGPATYVPPSRQPTRAVPIATVRRSGRPWLLVGVIALLGVAVLVALGLGWWLFSRSRPAAPPATLAAAAPALPTITVIQAPPAASRVSPGQAVPIQAVARDEAGVTALELWVNGRQVDRVVSPGGQGQPSLSALWQWTPAVPGPYSLEVRAYNVLGLVSLADVGEVTALEPEKTSPAGAAAASPEPTIAPLLPTATFTPRSMPSPTLVAAPSATAGPPSPTAPATEPAASTITGASLTITAPGLNVRTGPGMQYPQAGRLNQGDQVEIVGQASQDLGPWWQVRFPAAPGGLGWVSADAVFGNAVNTASVPVVTAAPPAVAAAPAATATATTAATATITPTATAEGAFLRAPAGKTLLLVSNRSFTQQPARLTLSEGKSAGGGREIDVAPGTEVQVVLEPDFYRALWSSTARGGFARSADFTAGAGQVMVMWIKPEDGLTQTEVYNELPLNPSTPVPTITPTPLAGYVAPLGKALLVVSNRSTNNSYSLMTVSGGTFGGGQEVKIDANTEVVLEMAPADDYRLVWTSPANGGVTGGREFRVSAGEVILGWIIPEQRQIFMQFPGYAPEQINQ